MEAIDYVGVALYLFLIAGFGWALYDIFANRLE
jgi:hypothetical protein